MVVLPVEDFLPVLPEYLAEDLARDVSVVRVLRVDPDDLRERHQQVLKHQPFELIQISPKELQTTCDPLITCMLQNLRGHFELQLGRVHLNQLGRVADVINGNVLFEVVEGKVKQIIDLAELDKLVVVF